jgi:hypothetical protein
MNLIYDFFWSSIEKVKDKQYYCEALINDIIKEKNLLTKIYFVGIDLFFYLGNDDLLIGIDISHKVNITYNEVIMSTHSAFWITEISNIQNTECVGLRQRHKTDVKKLEFIIECNKCDGYLCLDDIQKCLGNYEQTNICNKCQDRCFTLKMGTPTICKRKLIKCRKCDNIKYFSHAV